MIGAHASVGSVFGTVELARAILTGQVRDLHLDTLIKIRRDLRAGKVEILRGLSSGRGLRYRPAGDIRQFVMAGPVPAGRRS